MTAAADEQHVKLAGIFEDEIFFEVLDAGYESDSFRKDKKCLTRVIKNKNQQILVVNAESLIFERRTQKESKKVECLFKINCYNDSDINLDHPGSPVMLTVCDKGKNRVISCCNEGNGVYAKLQDAPLPTDIPEARHEAIFYLLKVKEKSEYYRFRSSLLPNRYLTFEAAGRDDLVKLVLREHEDVVEGLELARP